MTLLRMADLSRELTAGLLAGIGDLLGISDAGGAIAVFDQTSADKAAAARSWLLTTSTYRTAVDRLGQERG